MTTIKGSLFLKKYIKPNNISALDEDDFFIIAEKFGVFAYYFEYNEIFRKSSKILKYVLEHDKSFYKYFDIEAFNKENVDLLEDYIKEFNNNFTSYMSVFKDNDKLRNVMLKSNPESFRYLDSDMVDDSVIDLLQDRHVILNKEDIIKYPQLLNRSKYLCDCIKSNPELVFIIPDITYDMGLAFKHSHYEVTEDIFKQYPHLCKSFEIVNYGISKDSSIIRYADESIINHILVDNAFDNGYQPTYEHLVFNPALAKSGKIMKIILKDNLEAYKFIRHDTDISGYDFDLLIMDLDLKEEDLILYPELTKNYSFMYNFQDRLRHYNPFIPLEEKVSYVSSEFKTGKCFMELTSTYFDPKYHLQVDKDKLNEIYNLFKMEINETPKLQSKYYTRINNIMSGMFEEKYLQNKSGFRFSSIDGVNSYFIKRFKEVTENNIDINYVKNDLFNILMNFTSNYYSSYVICNFIDSLFNEFINTGSISMNSTNEFANDILNVHKYNFINKLKVDFENSLRTHLPFTTRRIENLIDEKKVGFIASCIRNNNLDKLGINEEFLNKLFDGIYNKCNQHKVFKDLGTVIDKKEWNAMVFKFKFGGKINEAFSMYDYDEKQVKVMSNYFYQGLLILKDKVVLSDDELIVNKTGNESLDYNTLLYVDNNRYYDNLSELLLKLDNEAINKILVHKDILKEVAFLLPILNIGGSDDFTVDNFIKFISYYGRIRDRVIKYSKDKNISVEDAICINFYRYICIGKQYASMTNLESYALGKNVSDEISDVESKKYLDFYKHMLNRTFTLIPPISFSNSSYSYESGRLSDSERLLIGKRNYINFASCINLGDPAGGKTFNKVLLDEDSDVILIRNNENRLIGRILVFRLGNVLQLVPSNYNGYSIIYDEIVKQFANQIISNGDNIDYIVINHGEFRVNDDNFIVLDDFKFRDLFPHADVKNKATLVWSRDVVNSKDDVKLDFEITPSLVKYPKLRGGVIKNPVRDVVNKIRALSIEFEDDKYIKEDRARNFETFFEDDYSEVYAGDDWYIAIRKDGEVEEVLLPVNDERALIEFNDIKEKLELNVKTL